jgi:nitroimidazol reductase NimA-like FMN-containing flavoprotein (pyridoxamine 5'-phosphate oxidase superfamily)
MVSNSSPKNVKHPSLSSTEIDKILSMTLIANLATLGEDYIIHIVPMWFIRIGNYICVPTSRLTRKYKNLITRPHASVMIDISRAGLDLKGVLISGSVQLVEGEEARKINHQIHSKYVSPAGLSDPNVASYLSKGDDVTVKIHMDHVVNWNLADSEAGLALREKGLSRQLDG